MSNLALSICCILYLIASIDCWLKGIHWMALVFSAYAVANVGLMMAAKGAV